MHTVLIKKNHEKKRSTYKIDNQFYRKIWDFADTAWINEHVSLLSKVDPNYVLSHGSNQEIMWIDLAIINGIPATEFEHTQYFIRKVYNFCLENYQQTRPYAHGDWVLSNILIDQDTIRLVDWDNINIQPVEYVMNKMHSDLRSAFGDKFDTAIV